MLQTYHVELEFLKRLAHQAGDIMRRYYGKAFQVYTKPDQSKVTDVDLAISGMIQGEVKAHFPETGLYSEESENKNIEKGKSYFIIDELDGTSFFIDEIPGFSHQAAYFDAHTGQLEVGLVYYPIDDIMIYAVRGRGAFMEEGGVVRQLQPRNAPAPFHELRFAHPLRYRGDKYWDLFEHLGISESQVIMVTALRTLQFALRELDVMIFLKSHIPAWDLSGEKVIVEELALNHSYLGGGPVRFGEKPPPDNPGYLICPLALREQLREMVLEERRF